MSKDDESLSVKYYARESQFGAKEAVINNIVLQRLNSAFETIPHLNPSLGRNLDDLQRKIQSRPDHGREISCWFQSQNEPGSVSKSGAIYFYGKPPIVDRLIKECRIEIGRYAPKLHDVALSPYAVRI